MQNNKYYEDRVLFEVNKFITDFKQFDDNKAVTHTFTKGYCYWFALILCYRFCKYNPKMVYYAVGKHFAVVICNHVFDVTGDITSKNLFFEDWEEYRRDNPEEARTINNRIINKLF